MGNVETAAHFLIFCYHTDMWGTTIIYGLSAMIAAACLILMYERQGLRNYSLLLILLGILVYSVGNFIGMLILLKTNVYAVITGTIAGVGGMTTHWIITYTYIVVAFETKQMLSQETYENNPESTAKVDSFRKTMFIANVCVFAFIAMLTICWLIMGDNLQGTFYFILSYAYQAFMWGMLIAWVASLIKLYRDVKHSEKLLPDKKNFIWHGSLLALYLTLSLAAVIISQIADKMTAVPLNVEIVLVGMILLLVTITSFLEMATFFMVVAMMMPITQKRKAKFVALQRFLLHGFIEP